MNKKIKNIIIILLLISIIPLNINAMDHKVDVAEKDDGIIAEKDNGNEREDGPSPTETVGEIESNLSSKTKYYFMTYPNGVEKVTENETEANNPEEELIYEGKTNEYGEIILEGWNSEGQLRIVEAVPNGYTTNQREIVTNLAESSTVGFVNNKGIIDPNTGRTLIFLFIISFLVTLVVLSLSQRRKNEQKEFNEQEQKEKTESKESIPLEKEEKVKKAKSKKKTTAKKAIKVFIFILIPVTIFMLLVRMNANAVTKNFVITVHDSHGNKMSNVEVKIYAKPIKIDQSPAVIFDANGGEFYDGTTKMYFRLPYDGCSFDEFYNSLTTQEIGYLHDNRDLSTRDGYVLVPSNMPIKLVNGQTILNNWEQSNKSNVITYYGNGGTLRFYGKELSSIKLYDFARPEIGRFKNGNNYLVGTSNSPKCSNYNKYGINVIDERYSDEVYLCWNSQPDGIYVNDVLFVGSKETCFDSIETLFANESFQIRTFGELDYYTFAFIRNKNSDSLNITYLYPERVGLLITEASKKAQNKEVAEDTIRRIAATDAAPAAEAVAVAHPKGNRINSLVIRENGEDVLSLTANDLNCSGTGSYADRLSSGCSIENIEKLNYLKEYIDTVYSTCYREIVKPLPIGEAEMADLSRDQEEATRNQ